MSVAVDTKAPEDRSEQPPTTLRRSGEWARRAPLLPALIFTIVVTQLPFVATLVISFMNWNAYYPDERGFAGLDNFQRVFTDDNIRDSVITTIQLTATVVVVSLVLGMLIALFFLNAKLQRLTDMAHPLVDRVNGTLGKVETMTAAAIHLPPPEKNFSATSAATSFDAAIASIGRT